jgi:glycosyltransferase involved in cell wall biosynthesis
VIPALTSAGHDVTLWVETDAPSDREPIAPASRTFTLASPDSVFALRASAPEILYCHGLHDPALEARLLDVAPAVFYAHNYYGTCISGLKTWQFPITRPCSRRFGWPCLMHFYPHRCGGLNPITMVRDYRTQGTRLEMLRRYQAILTNSRHMQQEYRNHNLPAEQVVHVALPTIPSPTPPQRASSPAPDGRHLVFAGRMDRLKGGRFLLDALPRVREALSGALKVTFAGDGPDRHQWERRAARLVRSEPTIAVAFSGWLARAELDRLLDTADLLVFPSVWPEPFGLAGLEAGLRGVPAAAFASGGIPDWLEEGVNGFTAPANPPEASGLAAAIVRCLEDPDVHQRLREGARRVAERFNMPKHLAGLLTVFEQVRARGPR